MEKCPKCGWFHTNECVPMMPPPMVNDQTNDHNPAIPHTRTPILVSAMRLLAQEIQSEDGVANAAIAEAADRLEEMEGGLAAAQARIQVLEMQAPGYAELERERIIRLINESETFYLADKHGVYAEAKIREALQP